MADERTVVAIKSEQTLLRSQQTTIEITLPVEFRRSPRRRLQSLVLPMLTTTVFFTVVIWSWFVKQGPSLSANVYSLYLPGFLLLAVLGFAFMHRVNNWLANLLLDWRGDAFILIDSTGLTDHRVSRQRIDWAEVESADVISYKGGVEEVELALKAGVRFPFRAFRLDYPIFNRVARSRKGVVLGIDVQYFDTDAYVIGSVIEALTSSSTAKSTPQSCQS